MYTRYGMRSVRHSVYIHNYVITFRLSSLFNLLRDIMFKSNLSRSQIYWLGDLNYRITEMDVIVAKHHIAEGNYASALMCDQLGQQRKMGRVFHGFHEAEINFKPTYKYDPGTDNWDSRFFSNCIKSIYPKRNELFKIGFSRTHDLLFP